MQRFLPRRATITFLPTIFSRPASSSSSSSSSSSPSSLIRPSPPKLPAEQQAEVERLQRSAATSSAFQPPQPITTTKSTEKKDPNVTAMAGGTFRDPAQPEFEGEKNPKTGEVGGPKTEPLRWGGEGDWSYNGRVTDF